MSFLVARLRLQFFVNTNMIIAFFFTMHRLISWKIIATADNARNYATCKSHRRNSLAFKRLPSIYYCSDILISKAANKISFRYFYLWIYNFYFYDSINQNISNYAIYLLSYSKLLELCLHIYSKAFKLVSLFLFSINLCTIISNFFIKFIFC